MKTILATTYAVHPLKGSEDAMGWNYILQIARKNQVICITRENNQPAIEDFIAENPLEIFENITFQYFDLPYWKRFWKRGSKGAMLYYLLWQKAIPKFVKKSKFKFDIAHNVTFPNDWTPSYLWKLDKPFVWGPIGHHPPIPKQYLKDYSIKALLKDKATLLVKNYFWKYSKALKNTIANANFIFVMNGAVEKRIDINHKKVVQFPSVATQDFGVNLSLTSEKFEVFSAGRFVPLKGFDITIRSFGTFIQNLAPRDRKLVKLTLVGSGPEENKLREIIKSTGLVEYVDIISWMDRTAFISRMKNADVFMFPSHEGAGMVVAEAFSCGLPVLCLDNHGPGEFITEECGIAVKHQEYDKTTEGLAAALSDLYFNPQKLQSMKVSARKRFEDRFRWNYKGDLLASIYNKVV